jgi:glycosyltransferase involved in cell wall biosynthesis
VLVYWDANVLASPHIQVIVVYGSYLLKALQEYNDLEFIGLLKVSRLKRKKYLAWHADLRTQLYIPPFSNWLLKTNAIYHGIDFKVPATHRLPRVVTIHDLSVFEKDLSDPRFQAEGIRYNTHLINTLKPDRIIVPTYFGRDHLVHYFPHTKDNIRVIPHGSEQAYATAELEPSAPLDMSAYTPFILCPGSVERRKNCIRLIEAFEQSRTVKDLQIQLIFAGGNGFDAETIRARAAASPLAKRIHFMSGLSAPVLQKLYKSALFTVYPSVFEGFGLPIVEAFALGSPLITSNIGAMAEVAGDAALTVDPYSTEALAAAMDKMGDNELLRDEFRAKGIHRARLFSWRNAAALTRDVYFELQP